MRALIVDDSATVRRIIISLLDDLGYDDCVEASDGRQALEHLAARPVDLVITDWSMPVMGGLELIRAIRSRPETAGLPVLVVSSHSAIADLAAATEVGVCGYVIKPFTADVLRRAIVAVLPQRAGDKGPR